MDTNQNVANNYHINAFSKGMNTDTSYDMVGADQYLFGLNIRITNNSLIFGDIDSNNKENVVSPVLDGISIGPSNEIKNVQSILSVRSIGNIGVIITKNNDEHWSVYKVEFDEDAPGITINHIYTSKSITNKDRFSTVILKEVEGVIKLYIADGEHPIMTLFIENKFIDDIISYYNNILYDEYLSNNMFFPKRKAWLEKISGNLKTQQVQYTYRLYRKYGTSSKLAPLTNKIHIIGTNRNIENGNAEDTLTDIGMKLYIEADETSIKVFDRMQVFRISYINPNVSPEVHLIYDDTINYTDSNIPSKKKVYIKDVGEHSLQQYSVEEFSALTTMTIVPSVAESSQGYLFTANCKDNTIIPIKDLGATYETIDLVEVQDMVIDTKGYDNIPGHASYVGQYNIKKVNQDEGDDFHYTVGAYKNSCCITSNDVQMPYNDIFTSSLLRSLHRNEETYRYGIVYYDKFGRHTNVKHIGDVTTPIDSAFSKGENDVTISKPLGVHVEVNKPNDDIVGFLIVRCEKSYNYTKNILQVALSRPVRQSKYNNLEYRTPYYPNMYLSTQFFYLAESFIYGYTNDASDLFGVRYMSKNPLDYSYSKTRYFDGSATNVENYTLYQAFASDINIRRNDSLQNIDSSKSVLNPLYYLYENRSLEQSVTSIKDDRANEFPLTSSRNKSEINDQPIEHNGANNDNDLKPDKEIHKVADGVYISVGRYNNQNISNKAARGSILKLDNIAYENIDIATDYMPESIAILEVQDVKNPNWENGFSNVQLGTGDNYKKVSQAIKQYKSYTTNIGRFSYNNWIANGAYDLAATKDEAENQQGNQKGSNTSYIKSYVYRDDESIYIDSYQAVSQKDSQNKFAWGNSWIGPGPVCLLLNTDTPSENRMLFKQFFYGEETEKLGTIIANIIHETTEYDSNNQLYYGFGNYFEFDGDTASVCVFDGDIYPQFSEFTNMFKTYDFKDISRTLPSGQIVYYIPMESKINAMFDYGMNYRNTQSPNLMLEPGEINGIAVQKRPLHQYNLIYSDNDWSIDTFYQTDEEKQIVEFPQRIWYSQLKTNGENIDNWTIFKPADYIDVDSRYGNITNMLNVDNTIYFWQNGAFGALSVNERSLVTDNNSETIQLGIGGVLQRSDYIDTKYGMRDQDFSSTVADGDIYWVDVINKAILSYSIKQRSSRGNSVANYGEELNVQNIINNSIYTGTDHRPTINYDLQTNELCCNCLKCKDDNLDQLIFNTKYTIATSIYTRDYDDVIQFNNTIIGINNAGEDGLMYKQYNKLRKDICEDLDADETFLSPTILKFVVNSSSSQTKVFDNLKIITLKRDWEQANNPLMPTYLQTERSKFSEEYNTSKSYIFETDIKDSTLPPEAITDREGNICYSIPRTMKGEYGDRLRGKWMVEQITDNDPKKNFCISHIITKFRQSYS